MNSIKVLQKIGIIILTLALSTGIGLGLLCLVYLLPTKLVMQQNVRNNIDSMVDEGNYTEFASAIFIRMHPGNMSLKTFFLNNRGMARDNYTDSLMLGEAVYDAAGASLLEKALMVYSYDEDEMPLSSLQTYLESDNIEELESSDQNILSYPRYWHGYLVILKPLLTVLTYYQIRFLNVILMSLLLLVLLSKIDKQFGRKTAISFGISVLLMFPVVIPLCMQYATMVYISFLAMLLLLRYYQFFLKDKRYEYFFLLVGIVTCYMDFLTYPILSLGMPLILLLLLKEKYEPGNYGKSIAGSSLMWFVGYAGIWACKWVLATAILHVDVISDALQQAIHRSYGSTDSSQTQVNALQAIAANFSCFTNILFLTLFVVICYWIYRNYKNNPGERKKYLKGRLYYLFPAMMPFLWYAILRSHSYDHSSFTYRALAVSCMAICIMFEAPDRPKPKLVKRKSRKK